jgi:hypothetical protein
VREFWSRAKVSLARCSVYNKVLEMGKDDDRDRLRFLVIEPRNRKARLRGAFLRRSSADMVAVKPDWGVHLGC